MKICCFWLEWTERSAKLLNLHTDGANSQPHLLHTHPASLPPPSTRTIITSVWSDGPASVNTAAFLKSAQTAPWLFGWAGSDLESLSRSSSDNRTAQNTGVNRFKMHRGSDLTDHSDTDYTVSVRRMQSTSTLATLDTRVICAKRLNERQKTVEQWIFTGEERLG